MKSFFKSRVLLAIVFVWAAAFSVTAHATENYKPGLVKTALANGETVFVEFGASWCPTCKVQARVIGEILSENPSYKDKVRFVRVDWDQYWDSEIVQKYAVRRHSTLMMLRGDEVLGKLIANTAREDIAGLIEKGV